MSKKQLSQPAQQTATGNENIQVAGSHNIISRITNLFAGNNEPTEQRNRRMMLNHVESLWVKGILEKSLHGATLLELGIKEHPDVLKYPWAIKRAATKEVLPAGTSMLTIFEQIGMGRSLLILGAPGSGKTTMLLELTRQLLEHARQDVTEPVPVVFNLSSWTEKLTLADWLVKELNAIYTVPKKVATTWVNENKMFLLLDGLDEVRQRNHENCVKAINEFRRENGLTNIAICSRRQEYAELEIQLRFDGAIEIQPLTSNQVDEYFKSFGEELVGVRQVLEKDTVLQELAETPLFLIIMTLAYHDMPSVDVPISQNIMLQRKHLFDTYIQRMFSRPERSMNARFDLHDTVQWLTWLARKMIEQNQSTYMHELMQPTLLSDMKQGSLRKSMFGLLTGMAVGLIFGVGVGLIFVLGSGREHGLFAGILFGIAAILIVGWSEVDYFSVITYWSWKQAIAKRAFWLIGGLVCGLVGGLMDGLIGVLIGVLIGGLIGALIGGFQRQFLDKMISAGQRISFSLANTMLIFLIVGIISALIGALASGIMGGLLIGLIIAMGAALDFGGGAVIKHYFLRLMLSQNNFLPLRLVSFLDYCVDLIFLRREGSGYIFVHPLLMEHFAAMYRESEKPEQFPTPETPSP